MMRRTELYEVHKNLGAKFVEFAGWEMPVQYSGIRSEHNIVRNAVGMFDISHMGEIEIVGKDAISFTQYLTTNNVTGLKDFQAQYTLICNHGGGTLDDIIVYKLSDNHVFICVNALNTEKVFQWIKRAEDGFDVTVLNKSLNYSQLAVQGPSSEDVLSESLERDLHSLKRFFFRSENWNGVEMLVAKTGFTGERGYELFIPWGKAEQVWRRIIDVGKNYNMLPCGLGARDTLRIEMGYSLYGHEIGENINPFDAGLNRFVKLGKKDFIGAKALRNILENGIKKKIMGLEMVDTGIPRQGYPILNEGVRVGTVTSGTLSPTLEKSIGLGFINADLKLGEEVEIMIRNSLRKAMIVSIPFYTNNQ